MCFNRDRENAKNNVFGFTLVYVLWIIVVLSLLVTGIGRTVGLNTRQYLNVRDSVSCVWAAKAGVERAIAVLEDDDEETDSSMDLWHSNDFDLVDVTVGDCSVTIEIVDESSKLNINTATKGQLLALPGMDDARVGAILDWIDSDSSARANGVEAEHYSDLKPSYPIRNGAIRTLRELLLVKGISSGDFYGEDVNLNGVLDFNENDGDSIEPNDNADGFLDEGWASYLTCYSYHLNKDSSGVDRINIKQASEAQLMSSLMIPQKYAKWIVKEHRKAKSIADLISKNSPKTPEDASEGESVPIDLQTYISIYDKITVSKDKVFPGLVNLNTASSEVLTALTEGDSELANNVVAYRDTTVGSIFNVAELIEDEAIGVNGFKKIADKVTVRSNVFSAKSMASSQLTKGKYSVEVVFDRAQSGINIMFWFQGNTI